MKYSIFFLLTTTILLNACTPKPTAEFTMAYDNDVVPVTVTFANNSKNAEAYMWDFGDGSPIVTDANPTHTFTAFGTLNVKLVAINGAESQETMQQITLKEAPRKRVEIVTTLGTMNVELRNETPKHRDNFIKLANEKYFEGLLFHRVIKGFMVQTGDPDSRNAAPDLPLGTGGPSYTIPAEFYPGLHHYKGALSAARQADQVNPMRASSGSQFYIVHGNPVIDATLNEMSNRNRVNYSEADRVYYKKVGGTPFLDGEYTVFGYVLDGFEVIDKIAAVPVSKQPATVDRPLQDVKIISVNVVE